MPSSDPLQDLKDEFAALKADVEADRRVDAVRFERIEADIKRLEDDHKSFVARSWAMVVLVLTATAGGLVAIITRAPTP
jgi:hypothetical protein